MAEAALARREARRRKILENSHNRLQLIAGKSDSDTCTESSIITPILSEPVENSVPKERSSNNKSFLNNGVINAGEESSSFLSNNHDSFATGDGAVASGHDTTPFIIPDTTTPFIIPDTTTPFIIPDTTTPFVIPDTTTPEAQAHPASLWETITDNKYDIVLLSLLIQLFYCSSLITFEGTYFFLPLIVYVTTKYFWFPKQHNSNIANVLLLLNGMSASRAQKIMSVTQYFSAFSQDVCIFLFTTICIQSLLQTLSNSLL